MDKKRSLEEIAMELIVNSGSARSLAFKSLKKAKCKHIDEAKSIILSAKNESVKAHRLQTELLVSEARGEKESLSILLVHAQDHLMSSLLAIEMAEEMIDMYKVILRGENKT